MERVTIRYCSICMHGPRAARLADVLRRELKVEVNTEHGRLGEFTILVGDCVVSKRTTIALHKDEQILESLRSHFEKPSSSG